MFGALPIIALNVYAIIDDKLNEKKKKEKEKLEIKILETKDYEIIKRDLNTTSCYEFKIK